MADQMDQILDECIRLVLQGVPVDECLARYPEHAVEIAPQLVAIERVAAVYNRVPSETAFARSRERLQAEWAALEQEEMARSDRVAPWLAWLGIGARRWATAAVAITLVLIAGAGAVAASANALPGELLYPVKQATEQATLNLAFSDRSKAELHLAYAERRAVEMSTLIERGSIAALPESAARLERHLTTASRLAGGTDDQSAQAFEVRLNVSAAASLAKLEQAMARAPEENREAVMAMVSDLRRAIDVKVSPTPVPTAPPSPLPPIPTTTPGIEPKPAPPPLEAVIITGTVQSLSGGLATVGGETVVVTASTEVSGIIRLGATVSVTGTRRGDGAILPAGLRLWLNCPRLRQRQRRQRQCQPQRPRLRPSHHLLPQRRLHHHRP